MRYPDYLIHFNPNHDPKTGQFAPATGSFKGVRVVNPNKNAIREGLYTKEGYVTQKAERAFDKAAEFQNKRRATDEAGEKLLKSDSRLADDFGGTYKNVDDPTLFWMVADDYGISGAKEYLDLMNDEYLYYRDNKSDIETGRRWARKYLGNYMPGYRMDIAV